MQKETEKPTFEVIVGNIGLVHRGRDYEKAKQDYDEYVRQSLSGRGRAGQESVTLYEDGEIKDEHPQATSIHE